ncbi:MAG: LysR family transcriptional regulator [Gammaproteobacteria bacterium]|nr:LysR family transcriptional regulator [Gammaproteobacteria bacterium]MBU1441980.1 LysR family transcriptional regulator [Gammaproteobacteria bacterium]MBU2285441.1 LysR family transcriptional regulator [Gammaproteobacteria bacterium]
MGIRELKTFVAAAEHGSLSAAAEARYLSIPAISAQVAALEEELGTLLFDRARKPARITEAGHALLSKAREVIALYEQLGDTVAEGGDLSGSLVLGSIPTALTSVIPKSLLSLRHVHPRLQVRVHHGLSPSFPELLRHGEIDAAIMSEPHAPLAGIEWEPFAREPIFVIAPRDAKGKTDEALLKELPYIRFNRHFWVSHVIEESLAKRRIVLRESMELDSLEAIALMVRHGLGVSIIPVSHAGFLRFHRLKAVALGRPAVSRTIGLAERSTHAKRRLTSALLAALRNAAAKSGEGEALYAIAPPRTRSSRRRG